MANELTTKTDKNILDSSNCVTLASILDSFNAPINEEQCWALCHQTVKTVSRLTEKKRPLYLLNGPANLYINKEGFVHEKSFTESANRVNAVITSEPGNLFASIGTTLFLALDYGLESQEERSLDPKLELLIDRLTCSTASTEDKEDENEDKESNDEGIERDSPEYEYGPSVLESSNLIEQILSLCNNRLSTVEAAESHYRAVCRALVAEAMELSSFLHKITSFTSELEHGNISISSAGGCGNSSFHQSFNHSMDISDCTDSSGALVSLEGYCLADWARLWMQVIQELRHGVKLKKVNLTEKPSFEFELTPYEMLLDDIRSRRYKLNKVKVNGNSPSRVTKDAHDLILDFIRSRPPLVPAANRKLPPPPVREPSLFEKLLNSIRQQPKLKATPAEAINQRSSPIRLGRVRDDHCNSTTCSINNNKYEQNNNVNINNNNIILNNNHINNNNHLSNNNNNYNKSSSLSSPSIASSLSCSSPLTKSPSITVTVSATTIPVTKPSLSPTVSLTSSTAAPSTPQQSQGTTKTNSTARAATSETTTTGPPSSSSKLSQQQHEAAASRSTSTRQPKYILQEDPESLQGPKRKLVKANINLKIILSIDDDDDDIIQIQYK